MKTIKRISIIGIFLCLCLVSSSCRGWPTWGRHPTDQPSTTWRSEDGFVEFCVPEDTHNDITGIIETEDQKLDVALNFALTKDSVEIYLLSDWEQWFADNQCITREEALQHYETSKQAYYDGTYPWPIEQWRTTIVSKDTFRIEVAKSTYFHEGDIIVFHKVDS